MCVMRVWISCRFWSREGEEEDDMGGGGVVAALLLSLSLMMVR